MNLYEDYCLPTLINLACGARNIEKQRRKIVPLATGNVLEIGAGSGLNFSYYDETNVTQVWALEPSMAMRRKAVKHLQKRSWNLSWIELPCEQIPLDDQSIDTVVCTYTLCTICDYKNALKQMYRVLKPGGKLLFSEHGLAPDKSVSSWQKRLNPLWSRCAGGCNLDRDIHRLLSESELKIQRLESGYIPGPKVVSYHSWGIASR